MSAHPRTSIGMPPDGAGRRFHISHFLHVEYIAATGSGVLIGDEAVGQVSGTRGYVIKHLPTTATTGALDVILLPGFELNSFDVGETVVVNGTTFQVSGQESFHVNQTQLVGGNNPYFAQSVDVKGAANIRFAEGSGQFDAFGALQVTQYRTIGAYNPAYDELPHLFSNVVVGGAEGEYDSDRGTYILRCGTGATDSIIRRSNKYHQYHPGVSQLIKMTVDMGDEGKDNVVRRWGYFDEDDGLFFELYEHTLNVVLRKNMGNGVEETRVPQSEWNTDRLDGTGISQMNVNPAKNNIWWIDLAYLGGGRVRFGVFAPDGSRVTAHIFENTNKQDYSYMRSATLPVSFEQHNLGTTGSTSEFLANLATVGQEQLVDPIHNFFGKDLDTKIVTGASYTHLGSIRTAAMYKGRKNRIFALPFALNFSATDTTFDAERNIRVALAFSPTLTTPNWIPHEDVESAVEYTMNSNDVLTGAERIIYVGITHPGKTINVDHLFPYTGNQFLSTWHNGTIPYLGVFVKPVDPADELSVSGDITWREYQ
jgi:hypothetical protein